MTYNEDYVLGTDGLAEEVDSSVPGQVDVRLRSGIEFHNGKTLTADDVIYSIKRILNPKEGLFGAAGLASIDPNKLTKMDANTVRIVLKQPDSTIPDQLGQYFNGIVPVGYERKGALKWVGTGPYKVQSFTPGQQSVAVRNENYWRPASDGPWFDQVTVTDFADPAAQVNALLAGQVDAITDIPFAQIDTAKAQGIQILEGNGGGWLPLCMAIDLDPFTDVTRSPGVPAHGRPPGRCSSRCCRATATSRTTSSPRSTRATRPTWRSASRTSSRPSRCSSRPARMA